MRDSLWSREWHVCVRRLDGTLVGEVFQYNLQPQFALFQRRLNENPENGGELIVYGGMQCMMNRVNYDQPSLQRACDMRIKRLEVIVRPVRDTHLQNASTINLSSHTLPSPRTTMHTKSGCDVQIIHSHIQLRRRG